MKTGRKPCHSMLREIIEEELKERDWTDPVFMISELACTSNLNVERLLTFDHHLTYVECYILDKAFMLSDGFFSRLQNSFERCYPEAYDHDPD